MNARANWVVVGRGIWLYLQIGVWLLHRCAVVSLILGLVLVTGSITCAAPALQDNNSPTVPRSNAHSSAASGDRAAVIMTDEDKSDLAFVRKLPRRGTGGVFDLSDPRQQRFLLKQWALAGITRERRPQLFKAIEALRQQHVTRRKGAAKALNEERDLSIYSTPDQPLVPINIISSFGQFSGSTYSATAYTSVPGTIQSPTTYAVTTIGLYDQNHNLIGNVASVEQFAGGYDMHNSVAATIPSGVTTLYAAGSYTFNDGQGGTQSGPLLATLSLGALGSSTASKNSSSKARSEKNGAGDNGTFTMLSQQPTDVHNNGVIKVCIVRTDSDCDYVYQSQNGQFIVQFPLQATFTVPEALQSLTNQQQYGSIDITVSQPNANQGSGCTLPFNFTFWDPTKVGITGNTMTWLFNPGPFSNLESAPNSPCFPSNSTVVYSLGINVVATNPDTGGTDYFFGSIVSRDNPPPPPPGGAYISPMVVAYGCIAEGTLVTMADGSRKRIEAVAVDEQVLTRLPGPRLGVARQTRGVEAKAMYRLTTQNGHSILLTDSHPVMTTRGVRMAKSVRLGDELITEEGLSAVRSVAPEYFRGQVWNLSLGAGERSGAADKDRTTFFANGILVGDGNIQRNVELAEREWRPDIRKILPREWLQDYLNYLADNRAAALGSGR